MADADSIYDLTFTDNHGNEVSLDQYRGKPLLVVNTASKCGFTPQYDGLQELHQEPGDDAEIEEFCRLNHGVTFPLSTKIEVNGDDVDPVIDFVKQKAGGMLGTRIKWNFTKFLVSPDGRTVKRYAPQTTPEKIKGDIESVLPS